MFSLFPPLFHCICLLRHLDSFHSEASCNVEVSREDTNFSREDSMKNVVMASTLGAILMQADLNVYKVTKLNSMICLIYFLHGILLRKNGGRLKASMGKGRKGFVAFCHCKPHHSTYFLLARMSVITILALLRLHRGRFRVSSLVVSLRQRWQVALQRVWSSVSSETVPGPGLRTSCLASSTMSDVSFLPVSLCQ